MIIKLFESITATTWLAIAALTISIISLILSLYNKKQDRQLLSAQKRTELLIKLHTIKNSLLDTKSRVEKITSEELKTSKEVNGVLKAIQAVLEANNALYNDLDKIDINVSPLKLEKIKPKITGALLEAEKVLDSAKNI